MPRVSRTAPMKQVSLRVFVHALIFTTGAAISSTSLSQETMESSAILSVPTPVVAATSTEFNDDVSLEGTLYGAFHIRDFSYFKNVQDKNPRRRREVDLERLVFEPKLSVGQRFEIEAEVEFEHGGTGTTMEFDGFEEFGEFESEIEQGGEVKIDKLEVSWSESEGSSYKLGLITVPVGVISQRHHPTEYFTVTRNRSEAKLLPSTWRSIGVGTSGTLFGTDAENEMTRTSQSHFLYQLVVVQGLNSEFFRKYNWIQDGAARKFETQYADSLAFAGRFDFGSKDPYRQIGASIYYGDSAGNRKKTDKLTVDAGVFIWDIHAVWESETWTFRSLYLRGYLQNSEDVSTANATLGGGANPGAFAPLGKEVEVGFAEIGYNLQRSLPDFLKKRTDLFVRYDIVDPMKETQGAIYRDPRFQETSWTVGFNYKPRPELVAKLQYSQIKNGLDEIPIQSEVMAGFGFYYSTEN